MQLRALVVVALLLANSFAVAWADTADGCSADSDCKGGRVCMANRCTTVDPTTLACSRDKDCPGELICGADNRCAPTDPAPTTCTTLSDCPGNLVCNTDHECVPLKASPPTSGPQQTAPAPTAEPAPPPQPAPVNDQEQSNASPARHVAEEEAPSTAPPFHKRGGVYAAIGGGYLAGLSGTFSTGFGLGQWQNADELGLLLAQYHRSALDERTTLMIGHLSLATYKRFADKQATFLVHFGFAFHNRTTDYMVTKGPGLVFGMKFGKYLGGGFGLSVGVDLMVLSNDGPDLASVFSAGLDMAN